MAWCRNVRPVPSSPADASTDAPGAGESREWPEGAQALAQQLHAELRITDRQWHALKAQPQRRAAEQLAAALVLLLDPANGPASPTRSPQREQATALVEHALGWLKGELRDPGCPSHGH